MQYLCDTQSVIELISPDVEALRLLREQVAQAKAEIVRHQRTIAKVRKANRIPVNQFGQEIVSSDYGDDDLSGYNQNVSHADEIAQAEQVSTAVMALLSEGERACSTKLRAPQPEVERAYPVIALIAELDLNEKAYRTRLREPDLYDEGVMYWIGSEAVVSVPIEKRRAFNGYVRCRGLVRCEAYQIERLTKTSESIWSLIESTCTESRS